MEKRQSIVVVDDTPANLRLLVGILAEKNYLVRPVTDGLLALSAIQADPPDLILLDIMMPNLSGYEVCERLKADERTRTIPVIFISAKNEVFDKVKAFTLGAVDYIAKPFQAEEVLARVETHLTLRRLQQSLEAQNVALSQTLVALQATQQQLINREKMAALGHLIAGIAHEINTPLGAIRASVDNIANALHTSLTQFPRLFQHLPPERQVDFLALVQRALEQHSSLSSREARQAKRDLIADLEAQGIANADSLAHMLVNMGIAQEWTHFRALLQNDQNVAVVQTAYSLFMQQSNSQNIVMAVERAAKIVFALKNYAHYDESRQPVKACVTEGIEVVLTLYYNQLKHGIEVKANYADVPFIACYPDELNQVWTNLIHNAIHAMAGKGTLEINVYPSLSPSPESGEGRGEVVVSLTDSGHGIPPDIQPRIFEPFFTTKPRGEGSGLGLDIVRKIVDRHQGRITFESQPGRTTFHVFLPIDA